VTAHEAVIGLEVHAELSTRTKMFCGCSTEFGGEPNSRVCPVCLGLPGSLPVANERAIEYVVTTGLALSSHIAEFTQFHRKNYFYPDMAKNYQISQYDLPICVGGHLEVRVDGQAKRIGITRVHLEEDTGKLIHMGGEGRIAGADYSIVDFNRSGIPLMEVVSEPDMRTPEEAVAYVQELRKILLYLGVSDCSMEQGSLRCDANVSLRPVGATDLGVKTEVKNMNSFRALGRALAYEIDRQERALSEGEKIVQETRHWDASKNMTTGMRSKEYAHDYRYFADPDLVPMEMDRSWIMELGDALPELPAEREKRFVEALGLPPHDASTLVADKDLAAFFEGTVDAGAKAKQAANWVLGELSAALNASGQTITEAKVAPEALAGLIGMVETGSITGKIAKDVFVEMFETGTDAKAIVEKKGLVQITDADAVGSYVDDAIAANPKAVEDLRAGKDSAAKFLVGQIMKLSRGQADPKLAEDLLRERLG
jgi:aspartyl-tRNA(Asn)/glutamyl-tRNA(Gln) amidotransferase subunit B